MIPPDNRWVDANDWLIAMAENEALLKMDILAYKKYNRLLERIRLSTKKKQIWENMGKYGKIGENRRK